MRSNDPIRIALVITPFDDRRLQLAAQIGVTDIVVRHPSFTGRSLADTQKQVESHGLKVCAVEGYIPHDAIVHGRPGRDEQIDQFNALLKEMGELEIPVCCFNFMTSDDWSRTQVDLPERGGALVTAYNATQAASNLAASDRPELIHEPATREKLFERLVHLIRSVAPAARSANVKLALHPDDPPVPTLNGHEQLLFNPDAFEKLFAEVPDDVNGMCFCQGTFATMGVDIPKTIKRFGKRIHYVHFRDVAGRPDDFHETFHDNGPTDMAAAMRAYRDIGFAGCMRPDHVPVLVGETTEHAGYTMQGRLHAVGYMRGLLDATR